MSAYTPTRVSVTSAGLTTATTAYAAGDQAGTEIVLTSIGDANGYVLVNDITMVDYSARIASHELRVYEAATTPAADNAAASWSDADQLNISAAGIIYCSGIVTDTNNATCNYAFKPFMAKCDASGHLYLDVVLRAVPTSTFFSAVSDLHFKVYGLKVS